jgi:hypothetical protein
VLNALELAGKDIAEVKLVVTAAPAPPPSPAWNLLVGLGASAKTSGSLRRFQGRDLRRPPEEPWPAG